MITRAASGVPLSTMAVLMASVFTVSIGYGVVLPLLPYLIERLLGTDSDAAQVSRSTGLLTGLYTLALFLFAPVWGHLSDRSTLVKSTPSTVQGLPRMPQAVK